MKSRARKCQTLFCRTGRRCSGGWGCLRLMTKPVSCSVRRAEDGCGRVGGSHLKAAHSLSVEAYRHRYGLVLRRALEAPQRRAARGVSTRERIDREPQLRAMLEQGEAAARSGRLTASNRGRQSEQARLSAQRPERRRLLEDNTARAAKANRAAADERLARRTQELGFEDVPGYLRTRHGDGWSVARLSAELQVARERVTQLLGELGLPRVMDKDHPVEVAALRRVDAPDLGAFLRRQHASGVALAVSAHRLGHSPAWLLLRARRDGLEHLVAAAPTVEQRAGVAARQAGFTDAAAWLAHRRVHRGESSRALQTDTGLNGQQVARLLQAGGVGSPTAAHLQHALTTVGWSDLNAYTQERGGWTVVAMSRELGVGDTFLAQQLRAHDLGHLIRPAGRNSRR